MFVYIFPSSGGQWQKRGADGRGSQIYSRMESIEGKKREKRCSDELHFNISLICYFVYPSIPAGENMEMGKREGGEVECMVVVVAVVMMAVVVEARKGDGEE